MDAILLVNEEIFASLYLHYPAFISWSRTWKLTWLLLQTSKNKIICWGLRSYQTLLSGSCFRGVKVQGLVPLLSLKGHTAWIPRSLDVIPWACDISPAVLYCLSILAISMPLCLRNPVRIIVRHVEFVKKPVDKTWSELQEGNIQTIVGMLYVPLWHLPLSEFPLLSCLPQQVTCTHPTHFDSLTVDSLCLQVTTQNLSWEVLYGIWLWSLGISLISAYRTALLFHVLRPDIRLQTQPLYYTLHTCVSCGRTRSS